MSVIILKHCPGCGKCVRSGVCPTNAIAINGGKAVIGESCIECGLCVSVCPISLIKQERVAPEQPVEQDKTTEREQSIEQQTREEAEHEQTSTGA